MKTTLHRLAIATFTIALSNCTTYVAPDVEPTTTATSTTTQTTTDPYFPGASVTTRKTTTISED
jgi:hypothetical protein